MFARIMISVAGSLTHPQLPSYNTPCIPFFGTSLSLHCMKTTGDELSWARPPLLIVLRRAGLSLNVILKGTSTLKKNDLRFKTVRSAIIMSLSLSYHFVVVLETALNKLRGTTDVMMDIEEMRVLCCKFFFLKYLTVKNS